MIPRSAKSAGLTLKFHASPAFFHCLELSVHESVNGTNGATRTPGAFTAFWPVRIICPMVKKPPGPEPERVAIPMSAKLIGRIDEYRWRTRLASRAAAIRALIEIGLSHVERTFRKPPPND